MAGQNSAFSDQALTLIHQIFEDAVSNEGVGNGVATGATPQEWMDILEAVSHELEVTFSPIKPVSQHASLKDLFNAHKDAILNPDGPCIVAFDASENGQLELTPDEYIEFNNMIEDLLFENGQAIYVHVMGGGDEPKVFIASKLKPTPYETKTKLEL